MKFTKMLLAAVLAAFALPVLAQAGDVSLDQLWMAGVLMVTTAGTYGLSWVIQKVHDNVPEWVWMLLEPAVGTLLGLGASWMVGMQMDPEWGALAGVVGGWLNDRWEWYKQTYGGAK